MSEYTFLQWLMFLAIYCIIGWIFESTYVSIKTKKLTNRGFCYGPWLPIYGFGAITLLFATLPVRNNYFLTFLFGMIAATILEYVTGVVMFAIFKVKYWDYSYKKIQFQGHICLSSSLAWGAMAVLLVNFLHKPIEHLVLSMSTNLIELLSLLFVMLFSMDFTLSVRNALDIRAAITKLIKENEELSKLQARIDATIAFTGEGRQELLAELKSKYEIEKQIAAEKKNALTKKFTSLKKRHPSILSKGYNMLVREKTEKE